MTDINERKREKQPHTWETPPTINIPCPLELKLARGVHAKKEHGPKIIFRLTEDDRALIEEECAALGITLSSYVRWCAVHTARELCRIRTGRKPRIDL